MRYQDVTALSSEARQKVEERSRHYDLMEELRALRAKRLMVFIDTMNIHQGFYESKAIDVSQEDDGLPLLDPAILLNELISFPAHDLIRAYWYDGEVSKEHKFHTAQATLHARVMDTEKCELVLSDYPGRNEDVREKGVDIHLAVDMVRHAFRDNYDVAILCSGDADFIPSLRAVKSAGKNAVCASYPCQLAEDADILGTSDGFIDLDDVDLAWFPEGDE